MSAIDREQRKRLGRRHTQRFKYGLANIKKTKHRPGAYIISKGDRGYHGSSGNINRRLVDEYYSLDGQELVFIKEATQRHFRCPVRIKQVEIGAFVDSYFSGDVEGSVPVGGIWTLSIRGLECGPKSQGPEKTRHSEVDPFKVTWRRVNSVFRHKLKDDEKLLRLSTETGRSVVVSKAHSLMMFREGRIASVHASELSVGDMLMIPRSIPTLINPSDDYVRFQFRQGRNDMQLIDKKIPVGADLMRLLGLFVSDGSYISSELNPARFAGLNFDFGEEESHLFEQVNTACQNLFGVTPRKQIPEGKRAIRAIVSSAYVQAFLEQGLRVARGAHNKRVPDLVWNVPQELQREFLQALWDGDGGATVSSRLASDMLYLVPMCLGCSGSVNRAKQEAKLNAIRGQFHMFPETTMYHLHTPPIERGANPYRRYFELGPPLVDVLKVFHEFLPFQKDINTRYWIDQQNRRHATERDIRDYCLSDVRRLLYERLLPFWDSHKIFRDYWKSRQDLQKLWGIKRETVSNYLYRGPPLRLGLLDYTKESTRSTKHVCARKHRLRLSAKGEDLLRRIALTIRACSPNRGVDFAQIDDITETAPTRKFVYDLEVNGVQCFFAGFGGVLVHNSRGDMRQVDGKQEMVETALNGGKLEVHYTKTKDDAHQLERELQKSRKMKPLVPPKSGKTDSGSTWH